MSEEAGIEPRTVATLALTARRSDHLASEFNRKEILSKRTLNFPFDGLNIDPDDELDDANDSAAVERVLGH